MGSRPKCKQRKALKHRDTAGRRIGEPRALWIGSFNSFQEKAFMIPLNEVKVTPRDQQVLNLLVQGCSNKEIAGQLNISPRTVKQHLRTLFLRAGIREGRKRVKLAIAMFTQQEAQS
jgi:DNA-binding NarL/FixJ family response regulator